MVHTAAYEPVISTWDDVDLLSDGGVIELSDGELEEVRGAWLPIFAAGVALGFAIGSRIWPK